MFFLTPQIPVLPSAILQKCGHKRHSILFSVFLERVIIPQQLSKQIYTIIIRVSNDFLQTSLIVAIERVAFLFYF
jgi:hypothetical protein